MGYGGAIKSGGASHVESAPSVSRAPSTSGEMAATRTSNRPAAGLKRSNSESALSSLMRAGDSALAKMKANNPFSSTKKTPTDESRAVLQDTASPTKRAVQGESKEQIADDLKKQNSDEELAAAKQRLANFNESQKPKPAAGTQSRTDEPVQEKQSTMQRLSQAGDLISTGMMLKNTFGGSSSSSQQGSSADSAQSKAQTAAQQKATLQQDQQSFLRDFMSQSNSPLQGVASSQTS